MGEALFQRQGIPFYSAGDLISQINGETYGANKSAANKEHNQDILSMQIEHLLEQHDRILLAGHFCIVNKQGNVDRLPNDVFKKLHIDKIILLEAEEHKIAGHLQTRDGKKYPPELVSALLQTEREMTYDISENLNCPIVAYCMSYTPADVSTIEQAL